MKHTLAVLILTLTTSIANAGVITLDFEGLGDGATIEDFYNGGTDSMGNSGTDYGIGFGSDALSCIDSDAGGSCNFANEPTASTVMFFLSGSAVLNFAAGFDTGFSFYYSSSDFVTVNVYAGENLTGALLGSINLLANFQDNNCTGDPTGSFCNWDIGFLAFAGIAKSIDFGGAANYVGFDNITFGSVTPEPDQRDVPAPHAVLIIGLAMLGMMRRKK